MIPLNYSSGTESDIKTTIDLIKNAKRPVILAGAGCVYSGAAEVLAALAEELKCPVATTYLHTDAFPCDHPLSVGPLGY